MAGMITAFDIGEAQVKLVSVSGGTIKKATCMELPDNLVSDGVVLFYDAMAQTLREAMKKGGIPRSKAAVILPDRLVFSRNVSVPPMSDAQLKYNLPFEFKDYLNQEKSRYYFDYAVQEIVQEEDVPKKMRLFACATLKETIEQYRSLFRMSRCKLRTAIPEEVAYGVLAANAQKVQDSRQDTCFVDVGQRGLRMYIYRGSEFRNRRSVTYGISNLEQAIADERGVDIHVAHTHLQTDYQDAQTLDVCRDLYNRMAVEIMKSVNFYNYNNRDQSLHRICLCGGGAGILPLQEAIRRTTDLELIPFTELVPQAENLESPWLYARAIGCALQK